MFLSRIALLSTALTYTRCQATTSTEHSTDDIVGYVYTSLNGEGENKVISFARGADGSLRSRTAFGTLSNGGSNRSRNGAIFGNFNTQNAIQIIEDSLLVVNAGGNTISVFELNRTSGDLKLMSNYDSRGIRPATMAVQAAKQKGKYWVVVGNQLANPNVQFAGADIQFFPDKQFIVKGRKALDLDRNLYLFSFQARTRVLTPVRRIDAYVGTNGGPVCAAFSPDGSMLAVSTWGIPHIFDPQKDFQQPSRVYVYDFSRRSGWTWGRRFFEQQGVAATSGFSWSPERAGGDLLYASNADLAADKADFGVTVLDASPRRWRYQYGARRIPGVQNFATGTPGSNVADIQTFVSRDGNFLWVTGNVPNIVSTFQVGPHGGRLSIVGPGPNTLFAQRPEGPAGDMKDLWESPDGKFLFGLGALESFQLERLAIDGPSLSFLSAAVVPAAAAQTGERGAFNFLGLTGFDLTPGYGAAA